MQQSCKLAIILIMWSLSQASVTMVMSSTLLIKYSIV
jgi:hypothetical protein